jgi:hypothetical protein
MPPEYQAAAGFSLDNWLTIIGFLLTVAVQSFAFWRWLSKELKDRDDALDKAVAAFNTQITRVDRDVGSLRTDLSVALAKLPTRDVIDAMLQARVGPIDAEVRQLTLELARNGLAVSPPGVAR